MVVTDGRRLRIDWEVVLGGAALGVAVAVPAIVLGATIARDSNYVILLYVVLMGGLVAAGRYAAGHHLEAPLVHGALAALTAYAVIEVVVVVARAVASQRWPDALALIFNGFMSASAGIFGALIATRAGRPRPASPEEPPPE